MDEKKRLFRSLKYALGNIALAVFGAVPVLYAVEMVTSKIIFDYEVRQSQRLECSKVECSKLEQILTEEKEVLGIQKNIGVSVEGNAKTLSAECYTPNHCRIILKPSHSSRLILRHELYRIVQNNAMITPLVKFGSYLRYHLYHEPTANLYALTGWKF